MTAVLLRALSVAAALGAATAARSAPRPVTNETSAPSPVSRPRERLLLDGWMDARATWYGGPSGPGPDGMDIFKGSCGFGQMSNHFVTAFNTDGGYDWGLTDKCGQVRAHPRAARRAGHSPAMRALTPPPRGPPSASR